MGAPCYSFADGTTLAGKCRIQCRGKAGVAFILRSKSDTPTSVIFLVLPQAYTLILRFLVNQPVYTVGYRVRSLTRASVVVKRPCAGDTQRVALRWVGAVS